MTILEGEFAMIFLAHVKAKKALNQLTKQLNDLKKQGLFVSVKEIKRRLIRGEKHRPGTEPWVVSVLGKDRAGIVFQVSKFIADHGLNITDLNSRIMGSGHKASYALILEIDAPQKSALIDQLKRGFQKLGRKLSVDIRLNPVESERF
jgi:glycine cleavage system transcriptional repressor